MDIWIFGYVISIGQREHNMWREFYFPELATSADNLSTTNVVLEVEDLDHLNRLLQHLRKLDGVIEARRR